MSRAFEASIGLAPAIAEHKSEDRRVSILMLIFIIVKLIFDNKVTKNNEIIVLFLVFFKKIYYICIKIILLKSNIL